MNKRTIIVAGIIFILGLVAGIFLDFFVRPSLGIHRSTLSRHQGQQGLINPLLYCSYNSDQNGQIQGLESYVHTKVDQLLTNNKISDIGLYYEDLNFGEWVGYNEKQTFAPSSMMKVPLMMAYLHQAQTQPDLLNKKIKDTDQEDDNSWMYFKPTKVIQYGQSYSVADLLKRMIENSDNSATVLLFNNMDKKKLSDIFKELDVTVPTDTNPSDFMSPLNFATFYRVLYNSTYLSPSMSTYGLNMLLANDFPQGITAGVPKNIKVAQKYGENNLNGQKELHDCGVIYYPNRPYLLCIMTKGSDYDAQAAAIKELSHYIYQQVDKNTN